MRPVFGCRWEISKRKRKNKRRRRKKRRSGRRAGRRLGEGLVERFCGRMAFVQADQGAAAAREWPIRWKGERSHCPGWPATPWLPAGAPATARRSSGEMDHRTGSAERGVFGPEVRVEAHGHQRWHIECISQGFASAADEGFAFPLPPPGHLAG